MRSPNKMENTMSALRYLPAVVSLMADREKCGGCGRCIEVCPHQVLRLREKKVEIADRDACMECGACARNCSNGAIEVESGVGCAAAVILGALRGTEPDCCCGGTEEEPPCCDTAPCDDRPPCCG